MIAVLLLFLAFGLFPQQPAFAALALWGAFSSAKRWKVNTGGWLELVLFYGALIGCALVFLGY